MLTNTPFTEKWLSYLWKLGWNFHDRQSKEHREDASYIAITLNLFLLSSIVYPHHPEQFVSIYQGKGMHNNLLDFYSIDAHLLCNFVLIFFSLRK